MKKNIALGLLSIISMIGAVSAAELNGADSWEIKNAAKWAAEDQMVTVGERPNNSSKNEPPIRWKTEKNAMYVITHVNKGGIMSSFESFLEALKAAGVSIEGENVLVDKLVTVTN
ncbi:hypothetical protein BPMI_02606 [Candidatus Burkholderia pumila]|uniref:Uncharacterized protein n=1 Tax=Candidatus Burkholderia pumila TaxID=1090375 RepID=A0ABR5HN12_9BURK|nr:hypothetical protein BPMI_02606 [Candidatus Burkholderia pumila]